MGNKLNFCGWKGPTADENVNRRSLDTVKDDHGLVLDMEDRGKVEDTGATKYEWRNKLVEATEADICVVRLATRVRSDDAS